jgi:pSer/pThr/pTyr-binding forkhead associated (FHA) protein
MKLSLVVMTPGKSKGQAIPVNLPQFIIGRDPQCNLRPASAVISKRHCAVLIKDGHVSVRDFDSTNGTFINDVPVKGEAPLKNEDILKIGPLEFKVALEAKPSVAKPTPVPPKPPPRGNHADDDSVAAMLLSLQEDGGNQSGPEATSSAGVEVPAGSTVMDLAVTPPAGAPGVTAGTAETPTPEAKPAPATKKPDIKTDPAHLAAKAILEKYSRRSR